MRAPMTAGVLFVALAVMLASLAMAQQFHETGPYRTDTYTTHKQFVLPSQIHQEADITLTYPLDANGIYPLVIAFNGYQCKAAWYADIVKQVASWGYVVMQYDLSGLSTVAAGNDREEVKYLQPLLDWLEVEVGSSSKSPVAGQVDLTQKAVLGHSRGGKLASLHYANRTDITTAVLLDPVDCGVQVPEHLSAVAALGGKNAVCGEKLHPLARSPKTAAVVGAGYVNPVTPCNPPNSNYVSFANQLGPGTWQVLINEAGHMQFGSSSDVAYSEMNVMCGHGGIETEDVITDTSTVAVAWLESIFRPDESKARLQTFADWLDSQQDAGALSFQVLLSTNNGEGHLVPGAGASGQDGQAMTISN